MDDMRYVRQACASSYERHRDDCCQLDVLRWRRIQRISGVAIALVLLGLLAISLAT